MAFDFTAGLISRWGSLLALVVLLTAGGPTFAMPPAPAGFTTATPSEPLPPALDASLRGIQASSLQRHIAFLADPRQQGRGLGTRGLETTAKYLAAQLAQMGLPPLEKSYFQRVPLREIRGLGGEVKLQWPGGPAVTWQHGATCLLPELEPQAFGAPVVFAGYGIREEALGHDDFRALDVTGKIVLLVGGLPPGPRWQRPELLARYGGVKPQDRYAARVELLDELGAKAVIALEADLEVKLASTKTQAEPFFRPAAGVVVTDEPPLVRVGSGVAKDVLGALGIDPARPETLGARPLPGITATLTATGQCLPAASRNVIAVLRGADSTLKQEAVVVGAHMDHLGLRGGVLHPGADDNASGVAALLEIARGLAASTVKPKRTVIFAFWTGEEDGKFGSGHYVRHPLWPLARTSVYVNLDMIGHPWTAEELRKLVLEGDPQNGEAYLAQVKPADFAEPGYAQWMPELAPLLAQAGRASGMALHLDPGEGVNGGSDYRDFARMRVPWIRFFGNYFPGYHEPSDTPENLDPEQVQRMARLAFATVWLLAQR